MRIFQATQHKWEQRIQSQASLPQSSLPFALMPSSSFSNHFSSYLYPELQIPISKWFTPNTLSSGAKLTNTKPNLLSFLYPFYYLQFDLCYPYSLAIQARHLAPFLLFSQLSNSNASNSKQIFGTEIHFYIPNTLSR